MATTTGSGSRVGQDVGAAAPALLVRWRGGFWGECLERTRAVTVPSIWGSLSDPDVSPGWRNFLIAAGDEEGAHDGPPFLDGDLYKWLEAAISLLETGPDPALESTVGEVFALVARIQRPDGYVHTPTLIAARRTGAVEALADRFDFETYNLGHLISAAVRHYRVTGAEASLDIARSAAGFLQDLATNHRDALARNAICPSHYMGVMELYRATREHRYLALVTEFLAVRDDFNGGDDNQDRVPVRDQRVAAGHAVRANYLYAGLADLVVETGDHELLEVLGTLWADVVEHKLYLTGGCGALYDGASPDGYHEQWEISRVHQAYGRAYQLPQTTAHNETCANIGLILWSERMLAATRDPRYADVIERVVYNSLLSGISLDGRRFCYTNPLRQVRELPYPLRMPGDTGQDPVPEPPPSDARLRTEYLSCFCCPPNLARTLARSHELAATASAEGVWINLYGTADITAGDAGAALLGLRMESEQPWEEWVRITVTEVTDGGLPLHLRIPSWAHGASIRIGSQPPVAAEPGTYHRLDRRWVAGERIELHLPMRIRLQRGHRLAEETTNQVAVTRGPVVYALESQDLPAGVRLEQVALSRDARFSPVACSVDGTRVRCLEGEARLLPLVEDRGLYRDIEDGVPVPLPVRLLPYFAWGNRGAGEMSVWLPLVW